MVYYIKTTDKWLRVDYPCYGILCEMNELSSSSWEGDVQYWDPSISEWENFTHYGWHSEGGRDFTHLTGFEPGDVVAIYTLNASQIEEIPDHDIFKHISLTTAQAAEIPETEGEEYFFELKMSAAPCDELFIPMFMIRNIFGDGDSDDTLYSHFVTDGMSPLNALVFANIWYKTTRADWSGRQLTHEVCYYNYSEDGSMFSNCKVGDVVSLLKGGTPNFMSSSWGDLERGYPSYGCGDGSNTEPTNPYTGDRHHISHCMIVQEDYPDEFLNTRLNNNGSYFSEEEFTDFIKEIMKHVEGT